MVGGTTACTASVVLAVPPRPSLTVMSALVSPAALTVPVKLPSAASVTPLGSAPPSTVNVSGSSSASVATSGLSWPPTATFWLVFDPAPEHRPAHAAPRCSQSVGV